MSVPEGEANLGPTGDSDADYRRFIVLLISGNTVVEVEDGNGEWNSPAGHYYGQVDKLLIIHLKSGKAMSRTKLTNTSEL